MTLIQATILGLVQGLTEFLPISSSAHLVLVPYFAGWSIAPLENIVFYVLVHFATMCAVIAYFYSDIVVLLSALFDSIRERKIGDNPYRRMAVLLIVANIPTGLTYLLIKGLLETTLETPLFVGIFLLVTGILLVVSELIGKKQIDSKKLETRDAVFIGFMQGLAILPGISRSGSTIAAGLFRGLTREEAARFSFLLSIPIIIAGALEETTKLFDAGAQNIELMVLLLGFLSAFIVGYMAIKYFLDYLKKHSLYVFAAYCFALGIVTIAISTLSK